MLSCFVIVDRSKQARKKTNLHLSIRAALYLKHVTLCENECICFLKTIALLSSCSFRINYFEDSFKFADNVSKIDTKLFAVDTIKHLIIRSMNRIILIS